MQRSYPTVAVALLSFAAFTSPLAAQAGTQAADPAATQRRIEAILNIPRRVEEMRKGGVPESDVRGVLDILIGQKVPPEEAVVVLETQRDAVAEHGPTDNFGAFVQAQLAAGKRGRDLAAAIRAEHQARGKGKPAHAGGPNAAADRGGPPNDAARGKRPEGAGGGRPGGAGGRPADAGKRPDVAAPTKRNPAADSAAGKRPGNPNQKRPPLNRT